MMFVVYRARGVMAVAVSRACGALVFVLGRALGCSTTDDRSDGVTLYSVDRGNFCSMTNRFTTVPIFWPTLVYGIFVVSPTISLGTLVHVFALVVLPYLFALAGALPWCLKVLL